MLEPVFGIDIVSALQNRRVLLPAERNMLKKEGLSQLQNIVFVLNFRDADIFTNILEVSGLNIRRKYDPGQTYTIDAISRKVSEGSSHLIFSENTPGELVNVVSYLPR